MVLSDIFCNEVFGCRDWLAMRIGFFGDGSWAHLALDLIEEDPSLEPVFVCGRSTRIDHELQRRAQQAGLPFFTPKNVNGSAFIEMVKSTKCAILASMSYDQIFGREILGIPEFGTINCHAGRLPFYRGRNVLNWALINDEPSFGITVHYIDEGIDTGDIILQETFAITDFDDYKSLLNISVPACATLLHKALREISSGTASRIPQSTIHPVGTYCVKRVSGDEIVDWSLSSRAVFNLIRAVASPGPEALTYLRGHEIRIKSAELVNQAPTYVGIPGSVVGKNQEHLHVKCGDSTIRISVVSSNDLIRVGDRFTCQR